MHLAPVQMLSPLTAAQVLFGSDRAVLELLAPLLIDLDGGASERVAEVLVKVLEWVFDPPPEALTVPWIYLAVLFGAALIANALASLNALRETRTDAGQRLRELQ